MPRPKIGRARTANNRRGPQRVANHVQTITREEVHKKLSTKKIGHTLSNSDDSDELVVAEKGLRNRQNIPRREIFGSGGLAPGDKPLAHKQAQTTRKRKATTATSDTHRSSTATSHAKNATTPLTTIPASTPVKSILKSPSTSSQPKSATQNNSVSTRPQSTPIDRSLLAGLKPRSRQPSLLAGLKQNAASCDDSDLAVTGLDEFEDIVPNDESTPLNITKLVTSARVSSVSSRGSSSVIGRKRKITPLELAVAQERVQSRVIQQASSPNIHRHSSPGNYEVNIERSILGENEHILPPMSTRDTREVQPDDDSINAPPASSSSPVQSPKRANNANWDQPRSAASPEIKKKATRRNMKPEPMKMTTEALQALLPSRRGQEKATLRSKGGEFDIPSDWSQEMQATGVDEDEDEASYLPIKRQRKSTLKKDATSKIVTKKGLGSRKQVSGQKRKVVDIQKGRDPSKATPLKDVSTRAAAKISVQQGTKKVTYSSRRLDISEGDKENQLFDTSDGFSLPENLGPDGSRNQATPATNFGSSRQEKRHWAMIDAYELDFEDMSPENLGSSSPGR